MEGLDSQTRRRHRRTEDLGRVQGQQRRAHAHTPLTGPGPLVPKKAARRMWQCQHMHLNSAQARSGNHAGPHLQPSEQVRAAGVASPHSSCSTLSLLQALGDPSVQEVALSAPVTPRRLMAVMDGPTQGHQLDIMLKAPCLQACWPPLDSPALHRPWRPPPCPSASWQQNRPMLGANPS